MLTKSEKQIMDLLWSVDKPLSCAEIVELSGDKTWKDSYVHSLIKSLLEKDVVKIDSFELISRSYARKFAPKVTKEEYYLREYFEENPENSMPALFAAFAKNKADKNSMEEIEEMIRNWKKERGIK